MQRIAHYLGAFSLSHPTPGLHSAMASPVWRERIYGVDWRYRAEHWIAIVAWLSAGKLTMVFWQERGMAWEIL